VFTAHWSLNMNDKTVTVDKHTKPRATVGIRLDKQTYERHMMPNSSTGIPRGYLPIKSKTLRIISKLTVGSVIHQTQTRITLSEMRDMMF
jgi:hypothetical protein